MSDLSFRSRSMPTPERVVALRNCVTENGADRLRRNNRGGASGVGFVCLSAIGVTRR